MKYCVWCDKPLTGRQEKYCCGAHAKAYLRSGGEKPTPKYCIYCNKELTGLQRLHCSDAHRMAYKRAQAKKQQ